MREIKFRIPHYDFKDNFVQFSYWGRLEKDSFSSPSTINKALIKKPDEQYTGLKDKNGKEIYEGDIVKGYVHDPEKHFFVRFHTSKYSCAFVATDNDECNPNVNIWYKAFEIIGNIHEEL